MAAAAVAAEGVEEVVVIAEEVGVVVVIVEEEEEEEELVVVTVVEVEEAAVVTVEAVEAVVGTGEVAVNPAAAEVVAPRSASPVVVGEVSLASLVAVGADSPASLAARRSVNPDGEASQDNPDGEASPATSPDRSLFLLEIPTTQRTSLTTREESTRANGRATVLVSLTAP